MMMMMMMMMIMMMIMITITMSQYHTVCNPACPRNSVRLERIFKCFLTERHHLWIETNIVKGVLLNNQCAAKEGFYWSYFGNQTSHRYFFCTGLFN